MNKASFQIDARSLKPTPIGGGTAGVWLEIGAIEFPARNWNDFAIVITGWWANAMTRLLRQESTEELIHFMDGPYAVRVTKVAPHSFMLEAIEDGARETLIAECEVAALPFLQTFIIRAQELVNACRDAGSWSDDVGVLQASLLELNKEFIRKQNTSIGW